MNEYFDKAYCINLDKRVDRWILTKEQFNKHNIIVERFSAVVGNPNNIKTHIHSGAVGCLLSHLNIINKYQTIGI